MSQNISPNFWCERVRICFSLFVKNPTTLQHLMLFGPPGSGKTTSAAWLVDQIWHDRKALMCMSMNAADERSLESIRQKVYPFISVDWRESHERTTPRFLILDECETLTEAAQLSLQTVLSTSPQDVCVILICNSQSRIHPKLRQRLLKIRYDPPVSARKSPISAVNDILRGDMRQVSKAPAIEQRMYSYLHEHSSKLDSVLLESNTDLHSILLELILIMNKFDCLDSEILHSINNLIILIENSQPDNILVPYFKQLIHQFRNKI